MHARKAILLVALASATPAGASEFANMPGRGAPANLAPYVHAGPAPAVIHAPPPPVHSPPPLAAPLAPEDRSAGHFYFQADALIAWLDSGRVPALVTTSQAGTPRAQAGVEGLPTTQTLFGDFAVGEDSRFGYRLRAGYMLDDCSRAGFKVGFLGIGREGETFTAQSNGSQILARPFFNTSTGANSAEIVAIPGESAGQIRIRTASDLCSVKVNLRCSLASFLCHCDGCGADHQSRDGCAVDFLFGYRGMRYRDKVVIEESLSPLNPTLTNRTGLRDSFYTRSMFNGLQAGLTGRWKRRQLLPRRPRHGRPGPAGGAASMSTAPPTSPCRASR